MATSKFKIVPKKENLEKPHIVNVDGQLYCVYGKEFISKDLRAGQTKREVKDPTEKILEKLYDKNYSFVQKVKND